MNLDPIGIAWPPTALTPPRQSPPPNEGRDGIAADPAQTRDRYAPPQPQVLRTPKTGEAAAPTTGRHNPRVLIELDDSGRIRGLSVESEDDTVGIRPREPQLTSREEQGVREERVLEMAGRMRVAAAPHAPADSPVEILSDRMGSDRSMSPAQRLGQAIEGMLGSGMPDARRIAAVA